MISVKEGDFTFKGITADVEARIEDDAIAEHPRANGYLTHQSILSMNMDRMAAMLVSWPVVGSDGAPVPITKVNVRAFYLENYRFCESILRSATDRIEAEREELRKKLFAGLGGGGPAL